MFPCATTACPPRPPPPQILERERDGTAALGDLFGWHLHVSLDGRRLAIGAPGARGGRGAVYVHDCQGCTCRSDATTRLAPANLAPGDAYGSSIAMSRDGTVLAVGAPGRSGGTGAVWVHTSPTANFSDVTAPPPSVRAGMAGVPLRGAGKVPPSAMPAVHHKVLWFMMGGEGSGGADP